MSNEEKVLNYIDDHKDEIIGFMQRLIQTKSITGDESAIAALMAEESERDGLEVELVEPAENRVSVVARYKGTTGKPNVMMYTHYDVVPPGDPETWSHPPFSGEITDGWIWGRGARDNKIATCGIAMAFRAIKECGIKLKGDIIFTHVADEEKGGKFGYRVILDKGYGDDVDFLFYPHGGDGNQVVIAANGAVNYYIKLLGRSAHTSRLEDGILAHSDAASFEKHGRGKAWARLKAAAGFRAGWSDAYGYLLLATGRVEVMLDPIMNSWDCAPFPVILQESGGYFGDWDGQSTIYAGEALGTTAALLPQVLDLIRG